MIVNNVFGCQVYFGNDPICKSSNVTGICLGYDPEDQEKPYVVSNFTGTYIDKFREAIDYYQIDSTGRLEILPWNIWIYTRGEHSIGINTFEKGFPVISEIPKSPDISISENTGNIVVEKVEYDLVTGYSKSRSSRLFLRRKLP